MKIFSITVTFDVLKLDKFIDFKEIQWWNIYSNDVIEEVLKFEISINCKE